MKQPYSFNIFSITTLCFLITSGLLVSCGGSETEQTSEGGGTPVRGEIIVIHQLSDPEGLNPIVTNDAGGRAIFDRVFEKLLDLDFESTEMIPQLAESRPVVSDDHLTYTFTLKDGITFSDGKPLTSADVVFSFKAVKNPLVIDAAPLRNYYMDVADVVAKDGRTIVFTMSKPYFLAEYFLGTLWILPKHILDPNNQTDGYTFAETNDLGKAQSNTSMKAFAEYFNSSDVKRSTKLNVGSGPYVFDEWKTGESVSLRRNTSWWQEGKDTWNPSYAEKLLYRVVNDRAIAVNALKNGELDFMEFVPPAKFEEEVDTVRTPHLSKYAFPTQSYLYIGWNMNRPVLSDKRVRKALSHLVDRDALIRQVVRGLAVPVNSPIYQDRPEYDTTIQGIRFNPSTARALLDEAGWADSDNDGIRDKVINGKKTNLAFTFLLNSGNEMREQIALIISDECRKLGVEAKLKRLEWSVFLDNLRTRNFDAYIGGWVNDPIDSDPYQIWHSSQADNKGSNYVSFRVPRADELLERNRTEFDVEKRRAYMREFQQIIVDEQPYTFLWSPLYPSAYNKRLQNVRYSYVRPGYNPTQWWVPKGQWKYSVAQ